MNSAARASIWNNPDSGNHPVPDNPEEVTASIRAAVRCMDLFPYLGRRFGKRGDAFARTDSGYLATLVRFPTAYVVEQVQWLARVLSNRGMPRWLMEVHLEVLETELRTAIPSGAADYGKLLEAAAVLSLSEILCVRHNMSARRSMYAKQDEQDETGSGAAEDSQRTH